ncbi:MAG: hypothetical protein ABI557_15650 [Aureliella sp.]
MAIPELLDGARVVCAITLDDRHVPTGATRHHVGGQLQLAFAKLAICQYDEPDSGCYLFYCDAEWTVVTDTWHETLDDAKRQAAFEYDGVSDSWQSP